MTTPLRATDGTNKQVVVRDFTIPAFNGTTSAANPGIGATELIAPAPDHFIELDYATFADQGYPTTISASITVPTNCHFRYEQWYCAAPSLPTTLSQIMQSVVSLRIVTTKSGSSASTSISPLGPANVAYDPPLIMNRGYGLYFAETIYCSASAPAMPQRTFKLTAVLAYNNRQRSALSQVRQYSRYPTP